MKATKRNKNNHRESTPSNPLPGAAPAPEAIRLRAHQIFVTRGGIPGRELEDWLLAEHELKSGRAG